MTAIGTPEIIGIGAFGLGALGIIWKMWNDHSKLANKVTEAFEKNARAQEKVSGSINKLEETVHTNTEVSRSTRDVMSAIIVNMMKDSNHRKEEK